MKRVAIVVALVGAMGIVGYGLWMSANAADIEFAVLSQLRKDGRTYNLNTPTGPSDKLLGRLQTIGIRGVRKAGGYGIELSIFPTGINSARVRYDWLEGSLQGGGVDLFMHKVDGQWKVEREVDVYQV